MAASCIFAKFELLGNTLIDFLERESYLQAKIAATMLLGTAATTAKSAETVPAEYVAKHREDVIHVH